MRLLLIPFILVKNQFFQRFRTINNRARPKQHRALAPSFPEIYILESTQSYNELIVFYVFKSNGKTHLSELVLSDKDKFTACAPGKTAWLKPVDVGGAKNEFPIHNLVLEPISLQDYEKMFYQIQQNYAHSKMGIC